MTAGYVLVKKSHPLQGVVDVYGAKNAVLVIITSLILTEGVSILENVPNNADVRLMIQLLQELGASATYDTINKKLTCDTFGICHYEVRPDIMNKMRASILVMGPLLARFGKARVALPGGDLIGQRPINYHLNGFKKLGVTTSRKDPFVEAQISPTPQNTTYTRIVLEYPSVGATENLMMFACLHKGHVAIINAALEPEIFDLIDVLRKMGAHIEILPGATILIEGVTRLKPIVHTVVPDRLEAGALLVAAAITGGNITVANARPDHLDIFLEKLTEMGHSVTTHTDAHTLSLAPGITLKAAARSRAVSFKTCPYPGFPTDLQPLMMAALCVAEGTSHIEETVYENRMIHVQELGKMGAQIAVSGSKATVRGVEALYGKDVIASDIRASCALALAGLVAFEQTKITGVHHWQRGFDQLENKLARLGAAIELVDDPLNVQESLPTVQTLPS
jgi:UDP-N-acetylglucosamine 1-carboxyvinyltransferase